MEVPETGVLFLLWAEKSMYGQWKEKKLKMTGFCTVGLKSHDPSFRVFLMEANHFCGPLYKTALDLKVAYLGQGAGFRQPTSPSN